jgi:glycosyltransferase involved in cell wall biosynthesis
MPLIEISVVIPTYNRRAILLRSLRALQQQTLQRTHYEVIVVDDGSSDGTDAVVRRQAEVRFFRQPRNRGPAAARNIGVRNAQGQYVLFLGDDIIAPPDLLAQHLKEHLQVRDPSVAVLGRVIWSRADEITPFMRYVVEKDFTLAQSRYDAILDPDHATFHHFYTSNVSLRRDFLLQGGLFDEDFRFAYGEDTELGYRLLRHGLRIIYRKHLVAEHVHATSYASARQRARIAGGVALLMASKHGELANLDFLRSTPKTRIANSVKRGLTRALVDPLLELADRRRWDHPLLKRAYDRVLCRYQDWGMLDAIASAAAPRASAPA